MPHALAWNMGTITSTAVALAGAHAIARHAGKGSATTSSGGCRRRPWGCRWCRSCNTSTAAWRSSSMGQSYPGSSASTSSSYERVSPSPVVSPSPTTMMCSTVLHSARTRANNGAIERVDDDDLVLGVVHDVGELLGEEPDVERVQHRPHGRDGQVRLEVLLVVPGEGAHPVVGPTPEAAPGRRPAARPRPPPGRRSPPDIRRPGP